MSKKVQKREKQRRRLAQEVAARKRSRKLFVRVIAVVLLLLAVGYWGATRAPPFDYTQCFPTRQGPIVQHSHFYLFIQIGTRGGSLNLSFIALPEDTGLQSSCTWPVHTHNKRTANEYGQYYTRVHIESPFPASEHRYNLAEWFEVWGAHMSYPAPLYFGPDGISYYRTNNFEMLVHRGWADPVNDTYEWTSRSYAFGAYTPADGDYIELKAPEPYTTLPEPYVVKP